MAFFLIYILFKSFTKYIFKNKERGEFLKCMTCPSLM